MLPINNRLPIAKPSARHIRPSYRRPNVCIKLKRAAYKLLQCAMLLTVSACAATSPPPLLPAGSQVVIAAPCNKPEPAPPAAAQAAAQSVDFSAELSTLLRDVQTA